MLEEDLETLERTGATAFAPHVFAIFEEWARDIDAVGYNPWLTDDGEALRARLMSRAERWLQAGLDAGRRERLTRLLDRFGRPGSSSREAVDLDALFEAREHHGIPLEVVELGEIELSAGVVVCDPSLNAVRPIRIAAPVAPARVRLLIAELPTWGRRVAVARLELQPGRARLGRPGPNLRCRRGAGVHHERRDAGLGVPKPVGR